MLLPEKGSPKLVSDTEPAGVEGLLLPPLTVTVTVNCCAVVMPDEDGVTNTEGVSSAGIPVPVEATIYEGCWSRYQRVADIPSRSIAVGVKVSPMVQLLPPGAKVAGQLFVSLKSSSATI